MALKLDTEGLGKCVQGLYDDTMEIDKRDTAEDIDQDLGVFKKQVLEIISLIFKKSGGSSQSY